MTDHPCSTLEQRWSACRARVYGEPPEPEDCADEYCGQWLGDWFGDRPCTSPRRHQCKSDFWFPWDTQDTYCDDRPDA